MRRLLFAVFAIMAAVLLPGCISSPGGIAPSTMPITSKDSYTIVRRNAEGSDMGILLLGLPLGPGASAYKALADAKKRNKADALINVTAENRYQYYLLFITFEQMVISGDAIKFRVGGEDVE